MKNKPKCRHIIISILLIVITILSLNLVRKCISGKQSLYGHTEEMDFSWNSSNDNIEIQQADVYYNNSVYRYNKDIITFLFLGIDRMGEVKRSKTGIDGGHSDAIFLVVLNPHTENLSIISIPRDTMTKIAVYNKENEYVGNAIAQLTLQHGYGDGMHLSCERTVEAVSNLFYGINIHGYCAVNMGAIPMLNDAIGGVEITALEDIITTDIKEGETLLLKGMDAYSYLHHRDIESSGSTMRRLERQKQYISAYVQTAFEAIKKDITLPFDLYNTLSDYMVTDISENEILYLLFQAHKYQLGTENILSLEGKGQLNNKHMEFYVDDAALYELILKVFYEEVK